MPPWCPVVGSHVFFARAREFRESCADYRNRHVNNRFARWWVKMRNAGRCPAANIATRAGRFVGNGAANLLPVSLSSSISGKVTFVLSSRGDIYILWLTNRRRRLRVTTWIGLKLRYCQEFTSPLVFLRDWTTFRWQPELRTLTSDRTTYTTIRRFLSELVGMISLDRRRNLLFVLPILSYSNI